MSSSLTHPPDPLTHEQPHPPPELFGQDQLERHAVALAGLYRLAPDPAARSCRCCRGWTRPPKELDAAYRFLSEAVTQGRAGGRLGRLAARQPSRRPGSGPRDSPGPAATVLPRAAEARRRAVRRTTRASTSFARELITHTAGRLDLQTLIDFAVAYQRAAPLTIGEIWAIAIMLRLALVEELRRLADGRRRGAPQPRSGARAGACSSATGNRDPERDHRRDAARRSRRRAAGCRRRSSSSCCTGCAISRRRPRRRGMRCSARSKRRTIRPRRCCASSISARPPTSSPSATSSRACGCCRRSTGRCSSSASAWSSRFSARIRPAPTREMDFPTRDRYRHSVEQLAQRREGVRSRTSRRRAVALARGGAAGRAGSTTAPITSATT